MKKERKSQTEAGLNGSGSLGKVGGTRLERLKSASDFAMRNSSIIAFAGMGMSQDEIQLAFKLVTRKDISERVINDVLTTAVTKGSLPNSFALEKEHWVQNGDSTTRDEQINKVLKLVIAREIIMAAENIANTPEGKDEWEKVVESMGNIDQPLGVVKKLLSRGASLSNAIQIANFERTQDKEPIIRFAQELAALDGMITSDLLNFYELIAICKQNHIELPHMADYIVLEAFLNARRGIKTRPQDLTLLNRYMELRSMFFNEETEDADESKELQRLNSLEDYIGKIEDRVVYRADAEGSYRLSPDGEKLRTPVGVEKGKIFFDNPIISSQRAESRVRIESSLLTVKPTKKATYIALWNLKHPK